MTDASALTRAEKIALVSGVDTWHTTAIPRLGIPAVTLSDGPNGARGTTYGATSSACLPCGTALGAMWDPPLVQEIGALLAREALRKGAQVVLAPTVNIHRHPLSGRNFECPSEDPLLASRYAAAFVTGVQSEGVAAVVKHFVCNDSEYQRTTISSEVGERALREIYLPPFEAAVRTAGAWAVMSAYNRINGVHASEHRDLLMTLLKSEWGFDGAVISDWWGTRSTVGSARNGLDLEMPGPPIHFGGALDAALDDGSVSTADLDAMVTRVLRLVDRVQASAKVVVTDEQAVDDPDDRALMRKAAAGGMVLLRNEGGILPLPATEQVVVVGPNGRHLAMQGGGSAGVEPHHRADLLGALGDWLGPDAVAWYPGCRIDVGPAPLDFGPRGLTVDYGIAATQQRSRMEFRWLGNPQPGVVDMPFSMRAFGRFVAEQSGTHVMSLVSVGKSLLSIDDAVVVDNWTSQTAGDSFYGMGSTVVTAPVELVEGQAYDVRLDYESPEIGFVIGVTAGCAAPILGDEMADAVAAATAARTAIVVVGSNAQWEHEGADRESLALPGRQDELIERVAAANARTIVVVNAGSPIAMPWADRVAAILMTWYPGQEGGVAVVDVLSGAVDPGGRLPTTFPRDVRDCAANLTYPGESGTVSYGEGVFVGYRGYERQAIEPLFAFGHGLSYGTFDLGRPSMHATVAPGEGLTVTVPVSNTATRRATTVVQVYVTDRESSLLRPGKELAGFAKVTLDGGASTDAIIEVGPRSFAAWDPTAGGWRAEAGEFEISIGTSTAAIVHRATVEMTATAMVP